MYNEITYEDDDDEEVDQGEVGSVWLPLALEDEIPVTADVLRLHGRLEAEICDEDGHPCEQTCDGRQGLEPVEDVGSARGDGHVCEETDRRCDQDTPDRHATLRALQEEFWSLTVLCQSEHVAGAGVEESISGRRSRGQDHSVDDGRQSGNPCSCNRNDPRTGTCAWAAVQESLVVCRHGDTDSKRSEDIEEQDTPEDSAYSLGDVLARVFSFSGSHCHHLHAAI